MPLSNGDERFAQGYTLVAVSDPGQHVISVKSRQGVCDKKNVLLQGYVESACGVMVFFLAPKLTWFLVEGRGQSWGSVFVRRL